jgi:5-methylcytosine-specific restriction endonuclease McrA
MECLACGNTIKSFKKFCSKHCQYNYEAEKVVTTCTTCNREFLISRGHLGKSRCKRLCRSCVTSNNNLKRFKDPKNHPHWRGGHSYYQSGKHGRDQAGLSWGYQKQLALARDNYSCVNCGKSAHRRNPDVHHIVPFRVCQSHALENLTCLCRACHKAADAKIPELWGGTYLKPPIFSRSGPGNPNWKGGISLKKKQVLEENHTIFKACEVCLAKKRLLNEHGLCHLCDLVERVGKAKKLILEGIPHSEAARIYGVNRTALYKYLLKQPTGRVPKLMT